MNKPRKHVYHVGDRIRILRPRFVRYVGYNLHPVDLVPEVADRLQKIDMTQLGFPDSQVQPFDHEMLHGIAHALVRARGFGGPWRCLHYHDVSPDIDGPDSLFQKAPKPFAVEKQKLPDSTGKETLVGGKKTVHTGKRYGAWSGYDYEGNYDYEPGGLEDRQVHVLLKTTYGWIETIDVEPVGNLL